MSDILTLPPRSDGSKSEPVKNGYVPPHLRKGEKNTISSTPVAVDMSTQSFPEINTEVKKTTPSNVWSKTTFKKKIDDLLEFEKLSEIEKQIRLDKKRIMEGFVSLPTRISPEYRESIFTSQKELVEEANKWNLDSDAGIQGLISLETIEKEKL
jgi:predicted restriction endonuclease